MHHRYSKLGARPADVPIIQAFERWADSVGIGKAHQQDLIAWGLAQAPNTTPERLLENFYDLCARRDIPIENAGLIEAWRDGVIERGLPEEPAIDRAAAERELAEIRQQRRSDPDSYDHNHQLQDRERDLLDGLARVDAANSGGNPLEAADAPARSDSNDGGADAVAEAG